LNKTQINFPKFIIAGAAKAGTSSLCDYLGQHHDIFITQPKELNFFNNKRKDEELNSYLKYFDAAKNQVAGEGSVSYLQYSKCSAPQLKRYFPDLRLIFMLRNPIQRLYSDFWFNIHRGAVIYKTNLFEDVLFQKLAMKDPGNPTMDYRELLLEKGFYAKHLKEFNKYFAQSQIKIIFFEDFIKDTSAVLEDVYKFLGVSKPDNKPVLVVKNKTSYPGKLMPVYVVWKYVKKVLPQKMIIRYRNNLKSVKDLFFSNKKPEMSHKAKAELLEIYKDSIIELEHMTGRNLTSWKQI
jgi:hypothetical protein